MSLNALADTIIILSLSPKEPLITEQKENDTLFITNLKTESFYLGM
jgi:hypothetical protein